MRKDAARYRAAEQRFWQSEGVVPTERWLNLGRTGSKVRLQVVGDGPPLLFLHGASNSGTSWAPLVARLDGLECLVLDRPGCGLSEPGPTCFGDVRAFGAFAEALIPDVLDALGLDTADVVATSFGGYHALRTAAAHPDRIRRIVEFGWTVGAPVETIPLLMRLSSVRSLGRLLTLMPVSDRATRSMLAHIGLREALADGRVSQEAVDWFRAQLNHTATMRNEIDAGPPILHPIRGVNDSILLSDDLLGRIRSPVLLLWGTEDPFGGEAVAVRFAARIPNAELELMPGGHAVWMDVPEQAATVTRAFLSPP
jgi:2-hydroxy-6-oxonona-2,4-dienedioate hydrolase